MSLTIGSLSIECNNNITLVRELIKRRNLLKNTDGRIDLSLESTAVAIAASGAKLDLIDYLVSSNGFQAFNYPATLPAKGFWQWQGIYEEPSSLSIESCIHPDARELQYSLTKELIGLQDLERWHGWHIASVGILLRLA